MALSSAMTRRVIARARAERRPDDRGAAWQAVDLQSAVQHPEPVPQADQPRTVAGLRAAGAVVLHDDSQLSCVAVDPHSGAAGPRMSCHIGQQLSHTEIGHGFDADLQPRREVDNHLDRYGAAGRQRLHRFAQAAIQCGRMDPADKVTQLGQRVLGVGQRIGDQSTATGHLRRCEVLLGGRRGHRDRDQLGLGAVVQVTLNTAQGADRIVDDNRASLLQQDDPPLALGRAEQGAGQPCVGAAEASITHPRLYSATTPPADSSRYGPSESTGSPSDMKGSPVANHTTGETTDTAHTAAPTSTTYPIGVIKSACSARNPRLRQPTASVIVAASVCNRPGGRTNGGGASMVTPISRARDRYSLFHARPLITTRASSGMPRKMTGSQPRARKRTPPIWAETDCSVALTLPGSAVILPG